MPQRPPIHRPVGPRDKHARDRDIDRKRDTASRALYASAHWQCARRLFPATHPLCAECPRHERLTLVSVVDHVIPHPGKTDRFWDQHGRQPLCASCHSRKTAVENGGFGNRRTAREPSG